MTVKRKRKKKVHPGNPLLCLRLEADEIAAVDAAAARTGQSRSDWVRDALAAALNPPLQVEKAGEAASEEDIQRMLLDYAQPQHAAPHEPVVRTPGQRKGAQPPPDPRQAGIRSLGGTKEPEATGRARSVSTVSGLGGGSKMRRIEG